MRITYSDYILQGGNVLENIRILKQNGARSIELLMDGACWDDEPGWDRLAEQAINEGVALSLHPPSCDTNLTAEMRSLREASFELYRASIRLAARVGARSVVIHPGFCHSPQFDKALARRRAREAINRFVEEAGPTGVRLLIENVGFHHASLYTVEEYSQLLDGVDPIAGYLIDTGHAHINCWPIAQLIREIAPRVYAFHLHDNARDADAHLAMGRGTIPWMDVFGAMENVGEDCDLVLEYSPRATLDELRAGGEALKRRFPIGR